MAIAQSLSSILFEDLPTKIEINDKIYDINYSYRNVLKIITAFEDETLYQNEKIYILLKLLYKEEIPERDIQEACEKGIRFIDLGKSEHHISDSRLYSFTKDGSYILTGINTTHHIDLSDTPNLHWWKFMALFMDMDSECFFSELIYFRKRKKEGKLTKDEKKKYNEIKDIISLEDQETENKSKARKEFFKEFNK